MKSRYLMIPLILGIALIIGACDDAAKKYYLKLPVETRLLERPITCADGSVGYAAFVADNTAYGGKLKLLDGCTGVVDENFSDGTKGDGKGLLAGPVVAGFDLMVFDDGLLVAMAVPEERRIALKRLDTALAEVVLEKDSVDLDLMPRVVNTLGDLFFVQGDDFIGERSVLIDAAGTIYYQTVNRRFAATACDGTRCLAIEQGSGLPFLLTVDRTGAAPVLRSDAAVLPDELIDAAPFAGIAELNDGRFALWNNTAALIVDGETLAVSATIAMPYDINVTTVTASPYITTRIYSVLSDEELFAKSQVYAPGSDEDDLFASDADDESAEEDALLSDGDAVLRIAFTATEGVVTDADAVELPAGYYDAKEADAIWFATDSGRIFSYDMVTRGWMFDPQEEGVSGLPQLAFAGAIIPEEGDTTEANMPRIERVAAMRGLPFTVSYEFTYEALFAASRSDGGRWDTETSRFVDERGDFTKVITGDPTGYSVLLTGARNSEGCLIPARTGLSLPLRRMVNGQILEVDPGIWGDDIAACYGEGPIAYGIFPKERYLVRAVLPGGTVVERSAREMPAGWNSTLSREVSYSDNYIDILIQRRTDDVATARGLNFSFTVIPSRTFVGPDSADIFERMLPLPNGHVLLFSPQRSRLFEYSPVYEETVVTYR